jgi:hypothetical protein
MGADPARARMRRQGRDAQPCNSVAFRRQAERFAPSMRQRIDVAALYADALAAMPQTIDGMFPLPVPAVCPITPDDLLSDA